MVFLEFELEICGLDLSKVTKDWFYFLLILCWSILLGQSRQPEDNELAASGSDIKALHSSNYLYTILELSEN